MAQPPAGFVYNSQYGDYENPFTGQWWDPDSGQVFASGAPMESISGSSAPVDSIAPTLGAGGLAYAASSGAPAASLGAPAVPNVVGASIIPAGASAPSALAAPVSGAPIAPASAGMFAPGGVALQAAGIGAGAATGYQQLKGLQELVQDSNPKMTLLEHAAMFPLTGGLDTVADVFGLDWGHSKNYYDAKRRSSLLKEMLGENSALEFTGADGPISITPKMFAKDRTTFDYDQSSPTMRKDMGIGQALGYLASGKGGKDKTFTDFSGLYGNLSKKGVSAKDLAESYGLNHDTLYGQVHLDQQAGKISQEFGDALKNGLDEAFGVGAYAGGKTPSASKPAPQSQASTPQPASQAGQKSKPMGVIGQRYRIPVRK